MTGGGGGAVKCSHVGHFVSFLDVLDNEFHFCAVGLYNTVYIAPRPEMVTVGGGYIAPQPEMGTVGGGRTREGAVPVQSLNILAVIPHPPVYFSTC